MPTMTECLNACPRRALRSIARARRVPLRSSLLKADIIAALAPGLTDPAACRRAISQLPAAHRDLLVLLRESRGRLPTSMLGQSPQPLASPEALTRLGLAFDIDGALVVPDELLQLLPRTTQPRNLRIDPVQVRRASVVIPPISTDPPPATVPQSASTDAETPSPATEQAATLLPLPDTNAPIRDSRSTDADRAPIANPAAANHVALDAIAAIHDVAVLLALVHNHGIRVRTGPVAWLSPTLLNMWRVRNLRPSRQVHPPSELHTARRRFLHYLAETTPAPPVHHPVHHPPPPTSPPTPARAPLIAATGRRVDVTPAGFQWLGADPDTQYRTLVAALAAPDPARWRAFQLPGHTLPVHPAHLVAAVLAHPVIPRRRGPAYTAIVHHVHHDLRQHGAPKIPLRTLGQAIRAFAAGPLRWLGLMIPQPDRTLVRAPWAAEWPAVRPPPLPRTFAAWRIETDGATPMAAILHLSLSRRYAPHPSEHFWVEVMSDASHARPSPARHHRAAITAASFAAALHRGHSLPALADHLAHAIGRPLHADEHQHLVAWHTAATRAVIHTLPVLETTDATVIAALARRRPDRALIRRSLGRHAAVVDPARLPALVRTLASHFGALPRQDPALSEPPDPGDIGPGGAAALWLAARVYQSLGQLVRLPAAIPQQTFDALAARMTPAETALANAAAESVTEAVAEAMAGYLAFPASPAPATANPDNDAKLATIDAALAAGADLDITYYTAGRDITSRRRVEPYRIERRGNVPYLIAYCTRAGAERVFRIDRIRSIAICAPAEDETLPPF